MWILKLDSAGAITWKNTIGGVGVEVATKIYQLGSGGYILSAYSTSTDGDILLNKGSYDMILIELTGMGGIIWYKNYGSSLVDYNTVVAPCSDGGYLMAGATYGDDGDVPFHYDYYDIWMGKTDASGKVCNPGAGGIASLPKATTCNEFRTRYVIFVKA